MYQIYIKSSKRTLVVTLTDEAMRSVEMQCNDKNKQLELFQRLAAYLIQNPQKSIAFETHVFIKSLKFFREDKALKVLIHQLALHDIDHQYVENGNIEALDEPVIKVLDLTPSLDSNMTVDIAPFEAPDAYEQCFAKAFSQTYIDWIKLLIKYTRTCPLSTEDVPQIDRSQPDSTESAEAVYLICERFNCLGLKSHIFGGDNLLTELQKLSESILKNLDIHQQIDSKIKPPAEPEEAYEYALKQQKELEFNLNLKIKEYITNSIQRIYQDNNSTYLSKVNAFGDIEYINLEGQAYLIKKSFLIALYNAARDFYKDIWDRFHNNADEFAAQIRHFNYKFAGIATINISSLRLSPIEDAYRNLHHYTLKEFESKIDDTIKRCANINSEHTRLHNHQDAFPFVQKRLNALNQAKPTQQQAQEVQSPGEGNVLRPLIRLAKWAPGVSTTIDVLDTIKAFTIGKNKSFSFSPQTMALDEKIENKMQATKQTLLDLQTFLDDIKNTTMTQLTPDLRLYRQDISSTTNNIEAFVELLHQVERLKRSLAQAEDNSHRLAKKIRTFAGKPKLLTSALMRLHMPKEDINATAIELKHHEIGNEFEKLQTTLNIINHALFEMSSELQQLVTITQQQKELWPDEKDYTFTADIKKQGLNIRKHITALDELDSQINESSTMLIATETMIAACNAQEAIETEYRNFSRQQHQIMREYFNQDQQPYFIENISGAHRDLQRALQLMLDKVNRHAVSIQKIVSSSSSTTTSQFLTNLKNHVESENKRHAQAVDLFSQQSSKLLFCHSYVNAIFNFSYWQDTASVFDRKATMSSCRRLYHVPAPISKLAKIITSDPRFVGWETDVTIAEQLFSELQMHSSTNGLFINRHCKAFLDTLHQEVMANVTTAKALQARHTAIGYLAQSHKHPMEHGFISQEILGSIKFVPGFKDRHPVLYAAMVGTAISLMVLAATALTLTVIALSGGAAIPAAFTALAIYLGSTGAAVGITALVGAAVVSIGAGIAALFGKYKQSNKRQPAQPLAFNKPDNLFEQASSIDHDSTSIALSSMKLSNPKPISAKSEDQSTPKTAAQVQTMVSCDDEVPEDNPETGIYLTI